jgi:hypothetical protein
MQLVRDLVLVELVVEALVVALCVRLRFFLISVC